MIKSKDQVKLFEQFIEGKFPLGLALRMGIVSLFDILPLLANWQGPIGMKLRQWYWKPKLKHMGKNVLLDTGLIITGPENISVSEYTWIDAYCRLDAVIGEIVIGKRIHIAHGCILGGGGGLVLEDYVGVSSGAKIYSHSEAPRSGKRMSGPMIPERYKAIVKGPVRLKRDSFIGAGAVVLPGITIGEGAVVGANSLVTKSIPDYAIAVGVPAKVIGRRKPVNQPEL